MTPYSKIENRKSKIEIHFLLDDLLVEAPTGSRLQEVVDACGADITFGCRNGSCGTCRVRVAKGLDHCSPPSAEERDFLAGLHVPPDHRLACQLTLEGPVDIEYLGL
jgi:ferredoxin